MKLHFKSYGKAGPDVVILHGLFGMLDNWQTFAKNLADAYRVYTPDLRNHGRSPQDAGFNYSLLAEDIVEFMQEHHLHQTALIGHSLGGKVAMKTALTKPDFVRKLLVIDIAPRAYIAGHEKIIEALAVIPISSLQSRKEVETLLMEKLDDLGVVLFLMKNVARNEDGSLFWRMNLPVLTEKYHETTAAIDSGKVFEGPTLFVKGGHSRYITEEDWPGIVKLFPRAKLKTIEKAGHWVHADAMDELLEVTRRFLSSSI